MFGDDDGDHNDDNDNNGDDDDVDSLHLSSTRCIISALTCIKFLVLKNSVSIVIIPILQIKILKHREVK